jgi:transposase
MHENCRHRHWKKSGVKQSREIVGVHADTVGRWLKAYEAQGPKALKLKVRGRREGSGRRLDEEQERRIQKLLIDKTPDQLKMPYALWTRESVRELIKDQLGIELPIRTVGHYLKRWGMTPQKPVKQAYEQQPARVRKWLDEEYPHIQAKAKEEDAEVYWGDETGLRNDAQHERGYALKGKTPVIRLNAKRESVNMISAITNQGKVRFKLFEGGMNAAILIDFLKRLVKDAKQRKVILILDNLRVHHAKKVKDWLAGKEEQIEIFYLPPYSPELNPDEYLNCDLKAEDQLKKKVISHMRMLQRKATRVAKYFKHEKIRYAA